MSRAFFGAFRPLVSAISAAVLCAQCTDRSPVTADAASRTPLHGGKVLSLWQPASFCKVGSSATFEVRLNGGAPTTYTLADGGCVALPDLNLGLPDPTTPLTYAIAEISADPGFQLDSITSDSTWSDASGNTTTIHGTVTGQTGDTLNVSSVAGGTLTFYNGAASSTPPCPAGLFTYSFNVAGDLLIKYDQFPAPNDNSYGVNAVGWGTKGHKFSDLTGSDHAGFQLIDGSGVAQLSFNVDYLSANTSAPSGYSSLGVTGGDGKMLVGTADGITATTSLANNLNNINIPGLFSAAHVQLVGSVNVLVNSPPTDAAHATYVISDPSLAGWDFHDTYYVTISAAKLAAIGFDPATWQVVPNASQLHNSPAKPCPNGGGTACSLAITQIATHDGEVRVTINNTGLTDLPFTELALTWPTVDGKLKQVKLGKDVVYDKPDIAGGTAHLFFDGRRKIPHMSSKVLDLVFERRVDTDLSHYTLTATFGDCAITLGGGTGP